MNRPSPRGKLEFGTRSSNFQAICDNNIGGFAMHLRLGTRGSILARNQAAQVADLLAARGFEVETVIIRTTGDKYQEGLPPLGKDRGIFTKELQHALLEGKIDLAVHSLKDVPTDPVQGLRIGAVLPRASPFDVLVGRTSVELSGISALGRIGTGSARRKAQLLYLFPHMVIEPIRGNVDTRLRKLDEGQFDAIILAEAAMERLGLHHRGYLRLPGAFMLPAPAQGAIAVEIRTDDPQIRQIVGELDHLPSRAAVEAERHFLRVLQGGCLAPVAALGIVRGDRLILAGRVLSPDGRKRLDGTLSRLLTEAERLGERLAEQLLDQGAGLLITAAREASPGQTTYFS